MAPLALLLILVSIVYLGLGSNLGDRIGQLRAALAGLDRLPGTQLERVSPLYESAPWGVTAQPPFLNAVAAITTALAPHELLHAVKALEAAAGRQAGPRWGPRPLDIDLLLYDRPPGGHPRPDHPPSPPGRAPLRAGAPGRSAPHLAGCDRAAIDALLLAVADQPVTQVTPGAWWEEDGSISLPPAPQATESDAGGA